MLEHMIQTILPISISALELMGIFVVVYSALHAFGEYLLNIFFKKNYDLQFDLANGLAIGLEFKMAAEILKTVLVRDLSELFILGSVIVLRALLSFLIHFELKSSHGKDPKKESSQSN